MGCLFLIKVTSRVAKGKDKLAVLNTENGLSLRTAVQSYCQIAVGGEGK